MKGYLWGAASLLLVSIAQLMMKWGMVQLPLFSLKDLHPALFFYYLHPLIAVAVGITCYLLSMFCWFFTLRFLPLNRAYTLLSLSYVLVYLAAVSLPWFNENAHEFKTLGALLILSGVWLINGKSVSKTE